MVYSPVAILQNPFSASHDPAFSRNPATLQIPILPDAFRLPHWERAPKSVQAFMNSISTPIHID
jgi:hypothetical protein